MKRLFWRQYPIMLVEQGQCATIEEAQTGAAKIRKVLRGEI